jgi:hypothetical protein
MHSLLPFVLFFAAAVDQSAVLESAYSAKGFDLTADPTTAEWAKAPSVRANRNYLGEPIPGAPTEIRSRWTKQNLYLLYICPYDELNLKPEPNPAAIEQIDDIRLEPLKRGFGDLLDMLWPVVQPSLFAGLRIELETELRGNHHLLTHGSERFPTSSSLVTEIISFVSAAGP